MNGTELSGYQPVIYRDHKAVRVRKVKKGLTVHL